MQNERVQRDAASSMGTEDYLSLSVMVAAMLALVVGWFCDAGEAPSRKEGKTSVYIRVLSLLLVAN